MGKINPGSDPVANSVEETAGRNISVFVVAIMESGGDLTGDPVRVAEADEDGRFGWRLPTPHGDVLVLMPGVALDVLRDPRSTQVPCLKIDGNWWWWKSAVMSAAGASQGER